MYEELFSRFTEEFKSSIVDPDIHLGYTGRQRIKGGEYAEVAEKKLPALERRIYWIKVNAGVAALLLAFGAVLTALSGVGIGADWTLSDFSFPLFYAFCMGLTAVGGMWRALKLEKQRQLCELVVAHSEKEATEEKQKAAA